MTILDHTEGRVAARPPDTAPSASAAPAPAHHRFRRIVVGVDGSSGSVAALRWAADQASLTGAVIEAVTTWHISSYVYGGVVALSPEDLDLRATAAEQLDRTLSTALASHPDVEVERVVLEGPTAVSLLHRCEHADLLVLGSRGHSAVTGLLLGSVVERCLGHSRCPVVIVPADPHAGRSDRGKAVTG